MDEQETQVIEVNPAGNGVAPESGSLLAAVRARRAERIADEHLTLPVPTWGGELCVRYRVVDREELERQSEGERSATDSDCDFLIAACERVLVRDAAGGLRDVAPPEPLPFRFDVRLAELLGYQAEGAREVVRFLFNSNGLAIGEQALTVLNWMRDTGARVEGAILGESPAAPR